MSFQQFGTLIEEEDPPPPPVPVKVPSPTPAPVPEQFPIFGELIEETKDVETGDEVPEAPQEFGEVVQAPQKKSQEAHVTRLLGQMSARGLEHILSGPRELGDFLQSLVPKKTLIALAKKVGLGKGARSLIETTEKFAPHKIFPSLEQTQAFTKDVFGETFEPKNEFERKVGDTFGEFASIVFPFGGKTAPTRAFLSALGANAAKELGESLDTNPTSGEYAKIGAYVVGSFIQPKAAKKFYTKKYKLADEALPKDATVASLPLENSLKTIETRLKKGGLSSADKPAMDQIKNLREQMQGAQTPVESLIEASKTLNIERGNIYNQLQGNKPGIKIANRNLEQVSNALNETLDLYGKQNPEWKKHYREAQNAFSAVKKSDVVGKVLKRIPGKYLVTHTALAAILGNVIPLSKAMGISAAAYPAYKTAQTLSRIMNSPPLRKEYLSIYKNALSGNSAAVAKSVNLLNKALEASEKK